MASSASRPADEPSSSSHPTQPPAKRTRSRNGCLVCRARRIKCGLERPECKRCINYGAECVYPVKKAFDAAKVDAALYSRHNRPSNAAANASVLLGSTSSDAQEVSSGRALSPPTSVPSSSFSQPTPRPVYETRRPGPHLDNLPPIEMVHALFRKTKMGSFFNRPSEPPEFLSIAFPEPEDLRCFHHCLTYSLSILVVDEEHNPCVEHIAPMFLFPTGEAPLSVSALKYSMLAVGATHLSYLEATSRSPDAERTLELSREYRATSMRLLRRARLDHDELCHDAFLSACLMLATNDVLGAVLAWREPVRFSKEATIARGGPGGMLFGPNWRGLVAGNASDLTPPSPLHRYLVEQSTVLDVVRSLTTGERPSYLCTDSAWWEALGSTGSTDREWESMEAMFGFDRSLIRISCTLLTLAHDVRSFESIYGPMNRMDLLVPPPPANTPEAVGRSELNSRLASVRMELTTWHAEMPTRYMSPRATIGSMALWHSLQIIILREMQKRTREDPDVQSSAAAILELCLEVGDKVEFLNWFVLIAGSTFLSAEKRETVRNLLKGFAYQCCHELEVTREIVEEMWRRIDDGYDDESCGWREIALDLGRPVLLA